MKSNKLVFSFPPRTVEEPVTYHLIKDYDLKINILRASIDPGKRGRMVVELTGTETQLNSAYNYLERQGVNLEPLAEEIRHDEERCTSCTACLPACPTAALSVDRDSWLVSFEAQKCIVCLSCINVCPYKAMEVKQ
jgi:L-aspartate semialdehyde sulfurtransferase ferredoxin